MVIRDTNQSSQYASRMTSRFHETENTNTHRGNMLEEKYDIVKPKLIKVLQNEHGQQDLRHLSFEGVYGRRLQTMIKQQAFQGGNKIQNLSNQIDTVRKMLHELN